MKILFVNACLRGEESRTMRLCRTALQEITMRARSVRFEEVDLNKENIQPLNGTTLAERAALMKEKKFDAPMFRYARQFAEADLVVIGAPYWEYQFPAALRCYYEHITVGGLTFWYGEDGRPQSLCSAKRMLYLTTAGGPIGDRNFGFDYTQSLMRDMLGIEQCEYVAAEGLDIAGADVHAQLQAAEERARELIRAWDIWEEDTVMEDFKWVITIGREYGAGGRSVAKRLSEMLGIKYYDKDIIHITAEKTGFTEEMIEGTEERETGRMIFNWLASAGSASSYDQAIVAQAQTIRQIAKQGPCIIVGRGADYILRDFPNLINVFIYADDNDKAQYAMDTFGETKEEALKRVHRSDTARASYYRYLTHEKWGDLRNYDLTINSSRIGKAACADVIAEYAKNRKG